MLDLSNPNAPTRVSGFWKRNLSAWARARNARLPDRGGAAPYKGAFFLLPDGTVGGTNNPVPPINAAALREPILAVPAGVAARAEVLRRQIFRQRLQEGMRPVVLALTPGGLDYAQAPRIKPLTPSFIKGELRDTRRVRGGVQYFDQSQAPASVVGRFVQSLRFANPAAHVRPGTVEQVDGTAQADRRLAGALAMKTASVANPNEVTPEKSPSVLPLLVVAAVFFLVFRR